MYCVKTKNFNELTIRQSFVCDIADKKVYTIDCAWLPFENFFTSAWIIWTKILSENNAVISVL